jgi:hypothetical protein
MGDELADCAVDAQSSLVIYDGNEDLNCDTPRDGILDEDIREIRDVTKWSRIKRPAWEDRPSRMHDNLEKPSIPRQSGRPPKTLMLKSRQHHGRTGTLDEIRHGRRR